MVRIFFFIAVCLVALTLPLPVFVVAAAGYLLRYDGYELLAIALLIDAHYGASGMLYGLVYTTLIVLLLIGALLLKPRMSWYAT